MCPWWLNIGPGLRLNLKEVAWSLSMHHVQASNRLVWTSLASKLAAKGIQDIQMYDVAQTTSPTSSLALPPELSYYLWDPKLQHHSLSTMAPFIQRLGLPMPGINRHWSTSTTWRHRPLSCIRSSIIVAPSTRVTNYLQPWSIRVSLPVWWCWMRRITISPVPASLRQG